jgi:sulfite exporter TauE/SafE
MPHTLASLAALCHALPARSFSTFGSLLGAVFLAGLGGSLLHCAAMCGPFVLAQVGARFARLPLEALGARRRWREALLPAYHAGRLLTYAGLGAAVGGLGGALAALPGLHVLRGLALLAGGLLFAAEAFALTPARQALGQSSVLGLLFRRSEGCGLARSDLFRGVLLGFLPCGLVYAALAAAAGSGGAARGALVMAAFWTGTVPALVATGVLGPLFARRLAARRPRLIAPLLFLDAALLITLGLAASWA